MMPSYVTEYQWLFLSCSRNGVDWRWKRNYRISFEFFGWCFTYSKKWSKYPPEEKPEWHPFRDLLKLLKRIPS